MTSHASFLLSTQGPFAQAFNRFAERPSQRGMAEAVELAIEHRQTLLVEAGTGTGKTFAYLIPAIQFDGKTVISTGTRNLQDQLFLKDIPTVFEVLGTRRKVALLKGRQNYLCLYRLEQSLTSQRFATRETIEEIIQVRDWSKKTKDGDLSQVHFLRDDSSALPFVTSNADNCLGGDCPDYSDCYVAKARKRAMESDILVINHHLLMADMALKEDGFGELLPRADAYIVDEAHQLPDVASIFFGQSLSTRQITELARESSLAYHTEASDCRELSELSQQLEKVVADFRITLGDDTQRRFWRHLWQNTDTQNAYQHLSDCLGALSSLLQANAIRSQEMENLYHRAELLADRANLFLTVDEPEQIQWLETYRKSFSLNTTPLDVAEPFQKALTIYKNAAWILTSATLAVNQDFRHFSNKLGWQANLTHVFSSPFDYRHQALLYMPRYMNNPSRHNYTQGFIEHVLPLLKINRGRAFLLFTSHRAMNEAAELLQEHREFNWFVQGSASKNFILEQFKRTENSVLLGTFSFWEGVDVVGHALTLVAIDKLPFASPGDPVNQARIDALKQQGQDAFHTFQLPDAIIALKQGAGRLIRDIRDKGVLMIADPRLCGRDYGKLFLHDLPDMQPTRNKSLVSDFLSEL